MILFEQALAVVISSAGKLKSEDIPLSLAQGRILSKDIISDIDIPPFNKSAMDGYACRRADLDKPLKMIEIIPAGYEPQKSIGQGECAKIMTGAMLPDGADCVVMIEETKDENGYVYVLRQSSVPNISYLGEDVRKGEIVLSEGTGITPSMVAVLASVGCDPVPVVKRPIVGVLATGSELIEPFQKPNSVQIRNSNSYQLCAQIERSGCVARYLGIAEDKQESLDQGLKSALHEADVILLSGGVSMGDFDFVPQILEQNGVELKFRKIAIKPGKPTVFGICGDKYFFGLPGNPVSTFVLFEMLVRPFLLKLMGGSCPHLKIKAKLKEQIKRKKVERLEFIPIHLNQDGFIERIEYHGSAHIHAYIKANGLISFPIGVSSIPAGSEIEVVLI